MVIGIISCKSSKGDFSDLQADPVDPEVREILVLGDAVDPVEIVSFAPTGTEIIVTANSEKNFAVFVNGTSGTAVNYQFSLDGVTLITATSDPFITMVGTDFSLGNHTLVITASNDKGIDAHTFNVKRNNPPVIALSSLGNSPVNCVTETFSLSVTATDADSEDIIFSFLLNGGPAPSYLSGVTAAAAATVTFDPVCTHMGTNSLTVRATDTNGEYVDYSELLTVYNPNEASIDSVSPVDNPVVILSTESQGFIISASGNPPLDYEWSVNPGGVVTSCNGLSTCSLTGGDLTPGSYVFTATVIDNIALTDSHDFNVVINDRPSVLFKSPSNATTLKMNCGVSKNFQVTIEDDNFVDPGQTFSIDWFVNGLPNNSLAKVNDLGVYPMTSSATFSPNCSSALIGDLEISVIISDGYEAQTITWDVSVNYFSETCNNLTERTACTLVGMLGLGSGLDVVADYDQIRMYPANILPHPGGGFFISDTFNHVVWFYNNSGVTKTVIGTIVPDGHLSVVAGVGGAGSLASSQNALDFYLNTPSGLAYHSVTGDLYVADYSNNRIVKFDSAGLGTIFAGGGASNVDGAARTTHKCNNPENLILDETAGRLFVSCYGNNVNNVDGSLKYFFTDTNTGYTALLYSLANTAGTTGLAGTARTRQLYSLAKHPSQDIIFAADLQACQIMAVSYGDTGSYYAGAVNLSADNMVLLTQNSACGNTLNRSYNDVAGAIRTYGLALKVNVGVVEGVFFSGFGSHNVGLLNLTGGNLFVGGNTIAAGKYDRVFGTSVADYGRGRPAYTSAMVNYPLGIDTKNGVLYIADRNNFKVTLMDYTVASGTPADLVGNIAPYGYDSELDKLANKRRLYYPEAMTYDLDNHALYFMDYSNYRIRKVDLTTGRVTTTIGRGSNAASNTNPEEALSEVNFQMMRDLTVIDSGNAILYTDSNTGITANLNCLIRAFNQSGSEQTYFNQTFLSERVFTVAGNYVEGCGTWAGQGYDGANAIMIRLRDPYGLAVMDDMSNFYVSSRNDNCIHRVTTNGIIDDVIGLCGAAGADVDGAFVDARINSAGDLDIDSNETYRDNGNFFLVDRSLATTSYIKYANFSADVVSIAGIDIAAGEIRKIFSTDGYVGGVTSFDDQICYTQGAGSTISANANNVMCFNRITGIQTLRVGKSSASTVKGKTQLYSEQEGVLAESTTLNRPWGITFDRDGNLYISEYGANVIRLIKKWW